MDSELKLVLGKMLGEVYRIQRAQGICQISDSRIFGLLNGIEEEVEAEINGLESISKSQVEVVRDYLTPYYNKEIDLEELPSFLHARLELEREGISHSDLIIILKYLKSKNSYVEEIDRWGDFSLSNYDI